MSANTNRHRTRIVAILLAAGLSRRFGRQNKLLAEIDGKPLVRHVAELIVEGPVDQMIVVLGHEAASVRHALSDLEVTFVENAHYAEGIGASVAAGVAALGPDVEAAIICLGDMPGQTPDIIRRVCEAYRSDPAHRITYAATPEGRQRNPVLWPHRFFAELAALQGDSGAREILAAHRAESQAVPLGSEQPFEDIDTQEALERHRSAS